MRLARTICVCYWLLLTIGLLIPDPEAMLGIDELPGPPGHRTLHFFLFAILAFLVHASRWPYRRGWLVTALLGYALSTELVQAFIPGRLVELLDLTENLLGLAAGTAVWWLTQRKFVLSAQ